MRLRWLLAVIVLVATSLLLLWLFSTREVGPVESARESLRAAEAEHGGESVEAASALDGLVEALFGAGLATSPETVEHARRAVAVKQARLTENDAALAYSLGNLGAILHARGDFESALDVTGRSLAILRAQKEESPLQIWADLNNLAYYSTDSGDFNAARLYYDEALDVLKDQPPGARLAETQNGYAFFLHESGDYQAARPLFERALSYWEDQGGIKLVYVLNNLGRLLHDLGEYDAARERLERARTLVERLTPPWPVERAMVLNNLGYLLHDIGELDAAAELYEEARRLREDRLGPEHPLLAWTLSNLALLRLERGDVQAADALFKRALDIRTARLGRQHPLTFHSLTYLAALRLQQQALEESLELALEAEEIRRRGMLLEVPVLAERQALLRGSLDVFKLDATSLDVSLSVASLAAARGEALSAERVAAIWDDVIRSRGLVLDEMARRHRAALATDDPEMKRLFDEVRAARQKMANLWVRTGPGALFQQAEKDKETAEEALARAGWSQRDETVREEIGYREVRASLARLPAGSVVVAFVRYGRLEPDRVALRAPVPSYLAFVRVVGDEIPRVVPLGRVTETDALIDAWNESIYRGANITAESSRETLAEYRETSARLRARIWDPLGIDDKEAAPIFLVLDGALHRVSFASLAVAGESFLVEGRAIHHLTTEKDLPHFALESMRERPHGSGLLALARPSFESVSEEDRAVASPCLSSFDDLPATESEVGEILAVLRGSSSSSSKESGAGQPLDGREALVLKGDDANEASFKSLAPRRRYLHLATHGFYLDAKCVEDQGGARVRGLGAAITSTSSVTRSLGDHENPLLLSGIALSGANRGAPGSDEDGILTAEEVCSMDLSKIDWAVLSACKTGVGEIHTGEGIFGLRRAFRIAGARTLISSLWPVEDEATRNWMVALYRARFEMGLGTAEAVRAASLAVLAEGRREGLLAHPFFWAAFVAAGDWR